jgi:YVTN family beta-propeller protein
MSMALKGRLAALVLVSLICISCGDVYRPTIVPEPVTPPNPQNFHAAFTANTNGMANPGSALQIDVSGDTASGTTNVGISPVHIAVEPGGSAVLTRIWAANPGSSSVTVFTAAGALGTISSSTTINLLNDPSTQPPSLPVFVHSTEPGTMYVANSSSQYNTVSAINTATNAIIATIPVGNHPWAMAETPDGHKLYVVDRDSNDVTSINTADRSALPPISVGTSPQWALARSDSHRVYVLASDGTVSDIDSEFTSGKVDTVLNTFSVAGDTGLPVVGTSAFFYDTRLNRLHIPFMTPVAAGVLYEDAIYDVTPDPPKLLSVVPVRGPVAAPCAQCTPISVTALQDGTRAYVASYAIDGNPNNCASTQVVGFSPQSCVSMQVAVINELNNAVSKVVNLPEVAISPLNTNVTPRVLVTTTVDCSDPNVTRFRLLTASSSDSIKVFVSSCDAGGVATIRTTDDTYVTTVKAPVSLLTPIRYNSGQSTTFPPPQSPLFLISGP